MKVKMQLKLTSKYKQNKTNIDHYYYYHHHHHHHDHHL